MQASDRYGETTETMQLLSQTHIQQPPFRRPGEAHVLHMIPPPPFNQSTYQVTYSYNSYLYIYSYFYTWF